MAEPMDAINHLSSGNNIEFQNTINQILMNRVRETIANQKIVVANKMFNGEEGTEETVEVEDTETTAEEQ